MPAVRLLQGPLPRADIATLLSMRFSLYACYHLSAVYAWWFTAANNAFSTLQNNRALLEATI